MGRNYSSELDERAECPKCGSEDCVLVAYGVDGEGEWISAECEECGHIWMEGAWR